jgi:hypothetical protein
MIFKKSQINAPIYEKTSSLLAEVGYFVGLSPISNGHSLQMVLDSFKARQRFSTPHKLRGDGGALCGCGGGQNSLAQIFDFIGDGLNGICRCSQHKGTSD